AKDTSEQAARVAGIMKIHNYNTIPPHEKVRTRSAVSKETREANGTVQATVAGGGTTKKEQQQKKLAGAKQTASSVPGAQLTPELENTANLLALEAADKRGRPRRGLPNDKRQQENVETRAENEEEEEEQEVVTEEEEEEDLPPTSRNDEETGRKRRHPESVTGVRGTDKQRLSTDEDGPNLPQRRKLVRKQESTEAEEQEREENEPERLVADLNEDDRTSSSTVSAEETLDHVMDGYRKVRSSTVNNLKLEKDSSSATESIIMTMDDYQQQQHQEDPDNAMDDYEPAVTTVGGSASASEDIEDADGALAGNRLFRKKVKRKLPVRPNSSSTSSGGGAGGGTAAGDIGAVTSSKAKLQMVHEFPMLFLGLRRNRMFLVNSLAQWFDLNQRDIILTLRKIKQNESSARLGNVFALGATEVDLLFHTNVPKIADCLRNFILWPDDITMKLNVPINLRQHFHRIHLILNYLVVRVKQNAVQQLPAEEIATSYCPDEQCHKLKYLVASTLDGCVCFVSRAFGVQTDDEQLLSQSGFLTKFKTNTNLIAGKNFHNFEDRLANGHDHTNNNGGHGGRNRLGASAAAEDDSDLERVLGGGASNSSEDNFEDIVSEKISKSRTFKLKNYIENILENFQSHQILSPQTCIDARTLKLLDDIVVIVGALINLQKQEIE
ncbi:uncharacterized protein LOC128721906, partial [Anopheles nili]|uniref:uncharacterized protein LOC128721906 n=1 Tax=Anopheles nili TaxID=185578 RepID=UPI00237BDB9F